MFGKVQLSFTLKKIQITLKLLVSNFITLFILAVLILFFLYGIICKMNDFIWTIFCCKFTRRCANVTNRVVVCPDLRSRCDQEITSNVKLPSMVQKWVQVLLNYKTSLRMLQSFFLNMTPDLLDLFKYLNTTSSVWVSSRLHNP